MLRTQDAINEANRAVSKIVRRTNKRLRTLAERQPCKIYSVPQDEVTQAVIQAGIATGAAVDELYAAVRP